nr:immunoglobulin heavy chain junction region [Mus musculus]MBK4187445.1 immunoglobulin heavy chain junction region [Mus musculus]MBK4187446.1 immunoglobulin heavy chain junction region [Mus musculus]MBK4187447.1 immunoglobulin heavy chain junction region [Mus musculus]
CARRKNYGSSYEYAMDYW